jgi:hypothetical protein
MDPYVKGHGFPTHVVPVTLWFRGPVQIHAWPEKRAPPS